MVYSIFKILALATAATAITMTGLPGPVQNRKDITDIVKNIDELSIYIQAVASMMAAPKDDPLSYYNLMSVHGVPGGSFDGSEGVNNGWSNNCPHTSPQFPMWHRAFLALYEQTLNTHALKVAAAYPDESRRKYTEIAQNLRAPFWDWTQLVDGTAFPEIYVQRKVTINSPTGSQTIDNPLYSYKFKPNAAGLGFADYAQATWTTRYPTMGGSPDSKSRPLLARRAVDFGRPLYRDRLHKILTLYDTYELISNQGFKIETDVNLQDSIEAVHNKIHGDVGGPYGWMSQADIAAFDPNFMAHHAFTDFLFTLWQTLHPDQWFTSPIQENTGSFWYSPGDLATSTQGLIPFRKDASGGYWNADEMRTWTNFGYTYPAYAPDWTTESIRAFVDAHFEQSGPLTQPPSRRLRNRAVGERDAVKPTDEYMINIRSQKWVMPDTYSVYVMFGDMDGDWTQWQESPNFVGSQTFVGRPLSDKEYSSIKTPVYVSAQLPLNRALQAKIDSGELKDTSEAGIQAYLKANLEWMVVDATGKVYNVEDVPGLTLSVAKTTYGGVTTDEGFIDAGAGNEGPTGWTSKLLPDVYKDKSGGLSDASLYRWSDNGQ